MSLVAVRGVYRQELAGVVAKEAILAMIVFMVVGAIAGWIADHLIRDSTERLFRARVRWYRKGMIEAGYIEPDPPQDQ